MVSANQDFGVYRGRTLIEWLKAATSREDFAREEALHVLSELDAFFTPALIAAMGEPDDELLAVAVDTLARIGSAALPHLIDALKNENARVRVGATHALARFGAGAEKAVPALADALTDTEYVRDGALSALFAIIRDFHDLDDQTIRGLAQAALGPIHRGLLPVTSSLRLDLGIEGTETMTIQEIASELQRGAKFIAFRHCISVVILTFSQLSKPYFITPGQSAAKIGLPYTIRSLLLGWWGIPFGPIFTLAAVMTNLSGEDVTARTIADINERLLPHASIDVLADGLEIARKRHDQDGEDASL